MHDAYAGQRHGPAAARHSTGDPCWDSLLQLADPSLAESFMAVAELLSFTEAARRIYLSQSGLSRRVGRLEEVTGLRLLDRSTRRVVLTAEGESLVAHLTVAASAGPDGLGGGRPERAAPTGQVWPAALGG